MSITGRRVCKHTAHCDSRIFEEALLWRSYALTVVLCGRVPTLTPCLSEVSWNALGIVAEMNAIGAAGANAVDHVN